MNEPIWFGRFFFMLTDCRQMRQWRVTPHPDGGQINVCLGRYMLSFGAPPTPAHLDNFRLRKEVDRLRYIDLDFQRARVEINDIEEEIYNAIEALGTDAMKRQKHLTLAENITVTLREQTSVKCEGKNDVD